jgi:glycosyltransferase involved in cell wall biosynthesis
MLRWKQPGFRMIEQPLVSCIMIFLDAEKFIREAIESVFAQTYPDWELLLVDDGSTDGSTGIARSYAREHPERVRYLEHPGHRNLGMSAARNLGIANARGEYIAFLDADDVWLTTKLERQAALLSARPQAAMVYGPAQWWYSWTGDPEDLRRDYIHELGVSPNTLLQPPELVTRFLKMEGISPCTCSVLVRRAVVEEVGGFEEGFRDLYEDQAFFAKLCLREAVYVSAECLARYRQHPGSNYAITQNSGRYDLARPAFLDWLAAYLSKEIIHDPALWTALRKERLPYRYPGLQRLVAKARHSILGKGYQLLRTARSRGLALPVIRQLRSLQFRRLKPLGRGRQAGTPVVRYYWDRFLRQHRSDIRGTVLEIGTTATVRQYGSAAVTQADAIDLAAHSPEVTVVGDLARAEHIPEDRYDCFINQFTTHLIFDIEAALFHAVRILKPGGVMLVNFPCVDYYFPRGLDMGTGEPLFMYWWFTPIQVENLLRRTGLVGEDYCLTIYGNLFTRIAYQLNLPAEELSRGELEMDDPGHPLLICARVVKPDNWSGQKPAYRDPWRPDASPAAWNPETGHYAG